MRSKNIETQGKASPVRDVRVCPLLGGRWKLGSRSLPRAASGAKLPFTGMSAPSGRPKSQATGQTDAIDPQRKSRRRRYLRAAKHILHGNDLFGELP